MWDEFKSIKSGTKQLREFGLLVGGILVVLGIVGLWRGKAVYPCFLVPGALLVLAGVIAPRILTPLQKIWMGLALLIGFFMSRLVLTLLFYGVMTPIGFLMRLSGNDILDQRLDKKKPSYWLDRKEQNKPKASYENQY
ncbi:MAG: SxtJ family membrane protein [Candidatus Omnitrophica bacterium]|nr:SxtJ family membrane protein [Candidatus Omnitrophota bacterium]